MLERLIAVIAPHICLVCGSEGSILCDWCADDTLEVIPDRCFKCFAMSQDSKVCAKCRNGVKHVWIRAVYADTARALIYRLKFERAKAAAKNIADLMNETVPYLPKNTVVTWVPTATSRVRLRGYDQSYLIARGFARQRQLHFQKLLIRHGQARQLGASKSARAAQAAANYSAVKKQEFPNEVLLIDDILTTGATIEAAAKVLRKAGVKQVDAAVFAQKQ